MADMKNDWMTGGHDNTEIPHGCRAATELQKLVEK